MLSIAYREKDRCAILSWGHEDERGSWLDTLKRLIFDSSNDAQQEGGHCLSIPWWAFVSLRPQLNELFRAWGISPGRSLVIEDKAAELLRLATQNTQSYRRAADAHTLDPSTLLEKLDRLGFARELKPHQIRNICRIASIPSGATFSVPGAGKTTEALATFFFRANPEERLLVLAPKNAFGAWDEQLNECMPIVGDSFVRLRGGSEKIRKLLDDNPRFMLMTYQQFPRVRELMADYLSQHPTHVFLDESHRIKSGIEKVTPQAVLSVSHLPVGKLIMSGTPMPQSTDDLVPQFAFLYPEITASSEDVVSLMSPVYVRTNKGELGLPPVERSVQKIPMAPVQRELYRLMKFEVAREAATALSVRNKQAFRSLGKSVARLLQFVSNPALLSREIEFAYPDILSAVLSEGDGPKIKYVLKRARMLANNGHKVLIWSSFVQNVEYLAERLADLGALYIHGGVDAGNEDDDETREGKIKLFHDDPNVKVMVANPAAASEGISLHSVCHHALYLDRTFNAAHYLQSEDRIHRLGLKDCEKTFVEIVECMESVDETVRERLNFKVSRMAEALGDSSLNIDPIPLDPVNIEDFEDYNVGLSEDDIQALITDIKRDEVM